MLAWICGAASIVALGFAGQRDIENFCFGPYEIGESELDSVRDVAVTPHYFVRVKGAKVIDTGIRQTITHDNQSEELAYYALAVGSKHLIVQTTGACGDTVSGAFAFFPQSFDGTFFNTPEMRAVRSHFYPFMVDSTYSRYPGYFTVSALVLFCGLFSYSVTRSWKYVNDPATHPTYQRVVSWGDPDQLAYEIEREAAFPRYKKNRWRVTENYVVRSRFFSFNVYRISDVIWVHKHATRHWVYFIPIGRTFEAILNFREGTVKLPASQRIVDELLAYIASRAPWASYGFSKEFASAFSKHKAQICAEIDTRRAEYLGKLNS